MVTGGLGHIGSKLIHHFSDNSKVVVVDNMLTQRYCSLFNKDQRFQFIEKSIGQLTREDMRGIDAVVHLAAVTDAASSTVNKDLVEKINLEETKAFLDMLPSEIKIIYPSTTSVYGKGTSVPINEQDNTAINPQSPYAQTKYDIENYIKEKRGFYTILRFGTIFGTSPGMRFHTAVNKFCFQAANDLPITVWKQNYHMKRPYLGINDAVNVLLKFSEDDRYGEALFNVATGNYELSFIVEILKTYIPKLKIDFVDTPLLNQHSYEVDTSAISLYCEFKDSIARGIQETLELLK